MSFDFEQYYQGCFIIPVSISFFFIVFSIVAIIAFFRDIRANNDVFTTCAKLLILVVIATFFLCMNIGRLLNGGIYLLREDKEDTKVISGTITSASPMTRYQFPEIKNQYGYDKYANGVLITMNELELKLIGLGNFAPGDEVFIEYLPKSGYVLNIQSVSQYLNLSSCSQK